MPLDQRRQIYARRIWYAALEWCSLCLRRSVQTGEQQAGETDRLRDSHNVWAAVRQCNPNAVGRPRNPRVLWQTSRVPAYRLGQIVSCTAIKVVLPLSSCFLDGALQMLPSQPWWVWKNGWVKMSKGSSMIILISCIDHRDPPECDNNSLVIKHITCIDIMFNLWPFSSLLIFNFQKHC